MRLPTFAPLTAGDGLPVDREPAHGVRRVSVRHRDSLISSMTDMDDMVLVRCHPPRDAVLQTIEESDAATVRDCLAHIHNQAVGSMYGFGADMRVRRRADRAVEDVRVDREGAEEEEEEDDDVCFVQWFDGRVTVELPCWHMRLRLWRSNHTLPFRRAIVEDVLYHDYRERMVLSPLEVMQFLHGPQGDEKIVELLRWGTIVPLTVADERYEPSWSDAIISDAPGLRAALPWEFLTNAPNASHEQIRTHRRKSTKAHGAAGLGPLRGAPGASPGSPSARIVHQGGYALSRRQNAPSPQTPTLESLLAKSAFRRPHSPKRCIKFAARLEEPPLPSAASPASSARLSSPVSMPAPMC